MNKLALLLSFGLFANSAYAINTVGYVEIRELKAWPTNVAVYLSDNQEHTCSETNHKQRFLVEATYAHQVAFLLAAFSAGKAVSLAYTCDAAGVPYLDGIRMR